MKKLGRSLDMLRNMENTEDLLNIHDFPADPYDIKTLNQDELKLSNKMLGKQKLSSIEPGLLNVNEILFLDSIDRDRLLQEDYSNEQLKDMIKLLNNVGYNLKSGSNKDMINSIYNVLTTKNTDE